MTERYHSPLYLRLKAKAEAAFEAERQEKTMPPLQGKMPSRERLTELADRIQRTYEVPGRFGGNVGMTFSEMAALVRLALNLSEPGKVRFAEEVKPLTDPLAHEITIPAGVSKLTVHIQQPTSRVVLDGKPIEVQVGRGGGAGNFPLAVGGSGLGEIYDRRIVATPPKELDAEAEKFTRWPEDPRAPKGAEKDEKAAADFKLGDLVICKHPDHRGVRVVDHIGASGNDKVLGFTDGRSLWLAQAFRHATPQEIRRDIARKSSR